MRPSDLLDDEQLSFGVTAAAKAPVVTELEAMGIESFWAGGHIASRNPTPEAITYLAMLAAMTSRSVIGTAVLLLPLYQPVVVAKQLAELDHLTDGRVVLGVGAGGEHAAEYAACGVPLKGRGARLDDGMRLLRHLWDGTGSAWSGSHYEVPEVRLQPAPGQVHGPPIVVAGRGPAAMRRAAALGDGWMPQLYSARRYAEARATIAALRREYGTETRPFSWMAYVVLAVSDDRARAWSAGTTFLERMVGDKAEGFASHVATVGTPDEVVERLSSYVDAGARHFVFLTVPGLDPIETGRYLVERVLPGVTDHFTRTRAR